jgi:predicted nicotinamide N-methyase
MKIRPAVPPVPAPEPELIHPDPTARGRLLRRIHERYDTRVERLQFGPLALRFVRVADPDVVLDEVAEEEDRREKRSGRRLDGDYLHLPYWAELWDSAPGLARWLAERVSASGWGALLSDLPLPNTRPAPPPKVLDLGCGMGLTGTVAAALGARVLFADLEPAALLFARLNSLPFAAGAGRPPRVRTRQLNWQRDQLGERFDLILGADILYEHKQWEYLEPFWRAHLSPAGGVVLLGEPGRPTGDAFIDWVRPRGWSLKQFDQPVETRPKPIRLFRLTLA